MCQRRCVELDHAARAVRVMQTSSAMKVSNLNINQIMKGLISALPMLPLVMKRRTTPVSTYVLGGLGIALVGGVAAVMLMSPRTRTRALSAAKDTYGKVNDKVHNLRGHGESPMSNGLVDRGEYTTGSSGLSGI
jgi:hypothetical protein